MKLASFNWLADENIQSQVIQYFKSQINIQGLAENDLLSATDTQILQCVYRNIQIVLTQDSDFGKLIYTESEPFKGIVYLRSGHLSADYQIGTLKKVLSLDTDVESPFLVIVTYSASLYHIRIRNKIILPK